jgi:HEAT repeat protein
VKLLHNRLVFVGYAAAESLGKIGDLSAISYLEAAPKDDEDLVRQISSKSLKMLKARIPKSCE